MRTTIRTFVTALVIAASISAFAQGNGRGMGNGMGKGNMADMQTIHSLLGDHKKIKRVVTKLKNGVETVTESADAKVAEGIKVHALAMKKRINEGRAFRQWDPLFAAIFENHEKITIDVVKTKNGVKVTETSKDPYVITLIQMHAEGVNDFVKEGMAGMHKEHPAPPKPDQQSQSKFLGMGDGVTTCPVTGEAIDKSVSAMIQGKKVFFCCAGCVAKVEKAPKSYLKWAK